MGKVESIIAEVKKAVIGKDECIVKVLAAMVAGGHILIEDIPGVGKTTLALAFAKSMGMEQKRMQFTPDVLPGDITGFSFYDREEKAFHYHPGAVMCNLFLADELNRTSPKTQSALLEVMEEGQVSVDGITREVPRPFVVIATENPIGSAGTQMLPESQLARFLISISMGYPDIEDELEIVKGNVQSRGVDKVEEVSTKEELLEMQEDAGGVFIHDRVYEYIGSLVKATREHPMLELGLSPRGTIALAKMGKAIAYLCGRSYCTPKDVASIFPDVSVHRVRRNARARAAGMSSEKILDEILKNTQMPKTFQMGKDKR